MGSNASSELMTRLQRWLKKNAAPAFKTLERAAAATPKDIAALEKAVGAKLPPTFAAFLRTKNGGVPFFEYTCLSAGDIVEHHLDRKADAKRTFRQKTWVPFADDGGGNLWVLDLSGKEERVRRWERAGGQVSTEGIAFARFFERVVEALESGAFTYDADSGIFDGPFVDLLAGDTQPVTPETLFVYRPGDLDLDVGRFLPKDAGPRQCLFFIGSGDLIDRIFDAIPEPELDHAPEGMKLADLVFKKAKTKSLAHMRGLGTASTGFHAAKASKVEAWLKKAGVDVRPISELLD